MKFSTFKSIVYLCRLRYKLKEEIYEEIVCFDYCLCYGN